ncbi:MAG: serine hydrolase domain-containing protein [Planctomycetota bacterium]
MADSVAEQVAQLDAPGAVVAIHGPAETDVFAAGFHDENHANSIEPGDRFRLASVTKLYLATVVLQLADEGVIALDDPISKYVDGVPGGESITLRMLGRHISGLDDAIRQMPFHEAIAAAPGRRWMPRELIEVAFDAGVRHEPGTAWAYANTNTILLGMAIESATGASWRDQVRARILEPLELNDTGFDDDPITPRGYRYGKTADPVGYGGTDDHRWFDATDWSASWTNAAGEMTGTAADTAKFVRALFGGDLLSDAMRAELTDFAPTEPDGDFHYGFHAHRIGSSAVGHHGDVPGFSSSAVYLPEQDVALVVLCNLSAELDKVTPASKIADRLLPQIQQRAVLEELRGIVEAAPMRGVEVVLVENGVAGPAVKIGDADQQFRAGSISKLLTALLALRAQEAGVLSLNDPVTKFLPGVFGDDPEADSVTIAHLLEHTAGVAGSDPAEYAADTPRLLPSAYAARRLPFDLRWSPGLHFSYSNPGYTLAAAAAGAALGGTFDQLMTREVLGPLGMGDTTFDAESPPSFAADGVTPMPPWNMPVRPAGSMVTTAADLGKLIEVLVADDGSFLSPASIARLHRGETGIAAKAGGGAGSYGLGNFAYIANGQVLRGHWGRTEGFQATIAYDPVSGNGYVLLANTADRGAMSKLRGVLDRHVTAAMPTPPEPTSIGPAPDAVAGLYENYSHDVPQRAWLFALLDTRRLTPTDTGLRVESVFAGPPSVWTRVGENLYQAAGLPVASGATATIDGKAFWADGESYRRVSALSFWGRIATLAAGVGASVLAVFVFVMLTGVWLFRRTRGDEPRKAPAALPSIGCFAVAGMANVLMLAGFIAYHLGDLATIAQLGTPTVASVTLLLLSLIATLATIAGVALLWRVRSKLALTGSLTLGVPLVGLLIFLVTSSMVPLITW